MLVAETTPARRLTVDEAVRLHAAMMHAGDAAVERTHHVVMPERPSCSICRECIAKRKSHRMQGVRTSAAGQLTHADTWGPFLSALYYEGCRYIVVFIYR